MHPKFTDTPEVQDWQWRIATTMRERVEKSFATHPDEVDCVQAIVEGIRGTVPVTGRLRNTDSFKLEVESAFLHGSKSQVRFSIGGKQHQRELADLLVLATYVEDGTLAFQRACFIQAKRSGPNYGRAAARFGIDSWQLALLGSFPKFTGLSGILKGQTHQLRNRSGMLGAYGFLSPPGNLTVVSARVLNHLLGGRKSLTTKELIPAILSEAGAARNAGGSHQDGWWFDPDHCPECHEMAMHFYPDHCHGRRHARSPDTPVESVLTCVGLDEFVQSWSGLRLGEVWHAKSRINSDRALRACLRGIVSRVVQSTGALSELQQVLAGAGDNDNFVERVEHSEGDKPALGILSIVGAVNRSEG